MSILVTLLRWTALLALVALASTAAGLLMGASHHPMGLRWGMLSSPTLPELPEAPLRWRDGPPYGSVIDLYGNQLNPAVATYGIDAFGGAVERHFPELRVGRLRAPEG